MLKPFSESHWAPSSEYSACSLVCSQLGYKSKYFIRVWAIYLHINEVNSQAMGRKLRQPNHTSAVKKENNDIKCFSFFVSFDFSLPYHQKCPSVSSPWRQTSLFPQCWTVWLSARCLLRWLTALFISQLSTWIYIFIYTNRFGRTSRVDCLNSILAEEKIKAAVFEDWL